MAVHAGGTCHTSVSLALAPTRYASSGMAMVCEATSPPTHTSDSIPREASLATKAIAHTYSEQLGEHIAVVGLDAVPFTCGSQHQRLMSGAAAAQHAHTCTADHELGVHWPSTNTSGGKSCVSNTW